MSVQGVEALRYAVAAVLRAERSRRNLTQQELAEAAGVDQSFISQVLRGRKVLKVDQLAAICDLMGIRMSAVIEQAEAIMRDPDQLGALIPHS